MKAQEIIQRLQLIPHPEGGYYRETYRSDQLMEPSAGNSRNVCTAIYYMLTNHDRSHFHCIASDELWFFHEGEPLELIAIVNDEVIRILLGNGDDPDTVLQAIIPAGTWFAAHLKDSRGYALVSCTVAPGFDFADFQLADRGALIRAVPII